MKTRIALTGCVLLVVLSVVLAARGQLLDPEFQRRLSGLSADDAAGMFDLAVESLEQGQYAEVDAVADRMLAVDRDDPRAKYLKAAAAFYSAGGGAVAPEPTNQPSGLPPLPPTSGATPTDGTTGGETPAPQPSVPPANAGLSDADVAEIIATHGAAFRKVQKDVLMKHCATGQCHGVRGKGGGYYLQREQATADRTLAENFKATERYVNIMERDESRLLKMALAGREVHPGGPVFRNANHPAYRQLKTWVEQLPGMFD